MRNATVLLAFILRADIHPDPNRGRVNLIYDLGDDASAISKRRSFDRFGISQQINTR
jgi:hypothetical protein